MGILIIVVIILAVALIVSGIILSIGQGATLRMPVNNSHKPKFSLTATFLTKIFPFTKTILEKTKLDIKFKNQINAAHIKLSPQELFNLKILIMAGLVTVGVIAIHKFNPLITLLALALGYFIPDLYLKKKIAQRKQHIIRVLPETVDLLGLCIEAGLDFTNAVKWVIDKTPFNPMLEELAFVLEEIKWGKPRTQSLKDMSRRLNIPEISSFTQTIIQAERMGTPVAEAFTILSEDARIQRFHRGERIALQAPIKILLPLIFCIMPVIGIVIGGPILLQFMTTGLAAGIK
ncbi:MAG: type II secretion system F family protein [Candidatus Omnitrophica bacterium]|nr:type II secretion system F family protein [Candidatus Omnitrophota bacterium]